MIEIEVVNAFSSLGIILNNRGGLEKYKASSVAESSHTLIAVNVLGQNTKHEMMCDQKYKVKISGMQIN
jgi:hypothetical protein